MMQVSWYSLHIHVLAGSADGFPVFKAIYRLFRYHFGSLALGSLILALIMFLRTILEFVEWQATKELAGMSCGEKLVKFIFYIIRCLLICLIKCVQFLNKTAYIEIAIWGLGVNSPCIISNSNLSIDRSFSQRSLQLPCSSRLVYIGLGRR